MTDSVNGRKEDEAPDVVDESVSGSLDEAVEEALDELPDAKLEEFPDDEADDFDEDDTGDDDGEVEDFEELRGRRGCNRRQRRRT